MRPLSDRAAQAYRRVDLDARIEASSGDNLTRICLEEAVAALGQALVSIEHRPGQVPHEALSRAHSIALWLARSVDPDSPIAAPLTQFYGGVASTIARNLTRSSPVELARARGDLIDLLEASKAQ